MLCLYVCTHLPPCRKTHLYLRCCMQRPCPMMTTWSTCMCIFWPQAKSVVVCSMYVMQWYYYSASSFWVIVLIVHHHSCLPPSLGANPFLFSAFIELYAMSKANLLWGHKKFMQISFMLRDFTCLCFYNVAHSVPAILTCPVSFVKPGVKVAFRRDDQFTGLGGRGWENASSGSNFKLLCLSFDDV